MSGFNKVFKEGWHPKGREGQKESWRGDFKGINQVAGWMGKGKEKDTDGEERVARPMSSLKDPSSFGPPPKHIKYHGPSALPNETTPDRRGMGAPLSQDQISRQNARQQEYEQEEMQAQEEEAKKPAPPPLPYRANRTGVDPSTLPPPPVRRDSPAAPAPPPTSSRPRPSVPPRMPPRNPTPSENPPTPPPAYSADPPAEQSSDGYLNQGATSRLAQAGVSVPAFGIGSAGNQWKRDEKSPATASPNTTSSVGQAPLNELQSRFSQMRTNSEFTRPAPLPPRGNSYSSESSQPPPASNTHSGSSTLNDFREKHNDKIVAGKQKLSGFDEKYGISSRAKSFFDEKRSPPATGQAPPALPRHPTANQSTSSVDSEPVARKKAPPPPPPKRTEMRSAPVNAPSPSGTPPPLPLSTKPR